MSQEIIVAIIGVITAWIIVKKAVETFKNRGDIGKCTGCSGCAFKQNNNQISCCEGVNDRKNDTRRD